MAAGYNVRVESVVTLILALVFQLTHASSLPKHANCTVGGLLPNTPCAAGLQCVIYDEGNIPLDQPALGNCRKIDSDTCFDKARGIYFAPGGTIAYSDCGPCKCPATGGKFVCEKCILAGGICTVGGFFRKRPLKCAKGLQCVLYHEGNILADGPGVGICKRPTRNTCYDKERGLLFFPRTQITNKCGPCRCPPKGGKIQCTKCIVEGGNCTVGGDFVVPPLSCKEGLQCILYDEGFIAADAPALGNCHKLTGNTCLDRTRGLYFWPRTKFSNGCGPCKCSSRKGRILCRVPVAECLVDPCRGSKCPKHPSAECQPDYCGGCKFKFYLNGVPVQC